MKQAQANRLVKLMDYIDNEVKNKQFDMATYCNTTHGFFCGCALGHATHVFPQLYLDRWGSPRLENSNCGLIRLTKEMFGVEDEEDDLLFGTDRLTRRQWLKRAEKVLNNKGYDVVKLQ